MIKVDRRLVSAAAPKRLEAALELLPYGCILADIGCDHGKLCLDALKCGKAVGVYACDISAPSLDKARTALEGYSARFFHTDGLSGVPRDFTAMSVCGMGGETMLEILNGYDGDAVLILQPQTHASDVRRTVSETGYMLEREILSFERGRFYPVMRFTKGRRELSELELAFGLGAEHPTPVLIEMVKMLRNEHMSYPENKRSNKILHLIEEVLKNEQKTSGNAE